jgi:hypothetical protein
MKQKTQILILLSFMFLISCGENKQEQQQIKPQNDISKTLDDATDYAKKLYGENVTLILKGDLNANGFSDGLAIVLINQKDEMKFWIKQGGVIEKDKEGWKVKLNFKEKLYNTNGPVIDQIEAQNGYIINFDMKANPVIFTVSIADKQGNATSDELTIGWNRDKSIYELVSPETKKIP